MPKPLRKPPQKQAKKPKLKPTFIRHWRKARGLTLDQLGDKVGMTGGNLSEIENGNTAYTQTTIEALAVALDVEVCDLLIRDPSDPEGIWSLWDRAQPAQRRQLIGMISGFLNSAPA